MASCSIATSESTNTMISPRAWAAPVLRVVATPLLTPVLITRTPQASATATESSVEQSSISSTSSGS